jgi:signal transduction histidine kinase
MNTKEVYQNLIESNKKEKEGSFNLRKQLRHFFFFSMILLNILFLFYTHLFDHLITTESFTYSSEQCIVNYTYNGICVIINIILLIKMSNASSYKKKTSKSFIIFTQFYFIIKTGLDYTNLIYLTPKIFKYHVEVVALMIYLMMQSLAFYYFVMKNKFLLVNFWQIFIILFSVFGFSILFCFLLNLNSKNDFSLESLLFFEIIKIIFYSFIFLLSRSRKFLYEKYSYNKQRVTYLEELNDFLMNSFYSSRSNGLVILPLSKPEKPIPDTHFISTPFFENLLTEHLNKRDYHQMKSFKSNQKHSGIAPTLKLSTNEFTTTPEMRGIIKHGSVSRSDKSLSSSSVIPNQLTQMNTIMGYKHFRPFSTKNVLRNLGDFNLKNMPKRKILSTQSLNLCTFNCELDDIKEENENELSCAYMKATQSKKSLQHRISHKSNMNVKGSNKEGILHSGTNNLLHGLDEINFKSEGRKNMPIINSDKFINRDKNLELFKTDSNCRINTEVKKKRTHSNFRGSQFKKNLNEKFDKEKQEEKKLEINEVSDSENSSAESSESDTSLFHEPEIQHLNTNNLDVFKESHEDSKITEPPMRYTRPTRTNNDSRKKVLKKLREISSTSLKYDRKFPSSQFSVEADQGLIPSIIIKETPSVHLCQNNIDQNRSGNNIIVNNKYNINIINPSINDHKFSGMENNNNIMLNIPSWKSDNNMNLLYNTHQNFFLNNNEEPIELFSNRFSVNMAINNTPIYNYQLLISAGNYLNCSFDIKNEKLKTQIFILNKSLGIGRSLSKFIKKLSEILNDGIINQNDYEDLEIGPYIITLSDNPVNNSNGKETIVREQEIVFDSYSNCKKSVMVRAKRIFYNNKNYAYIMLVDNNSISNFSFFNENQQFLMKQHQDKQRNSSEKSNLNNNLNNTFIKFRNYHENDFSGVMMTSPPINPSFNNSLFQLQAKHNNTSNFSSMESKNLFNAKVSALLHDFKHTIIDGHIFSEYIFQKYKIPFDDDDILYMRVMDDYFNSLILNITSFMKDSETFFKGTLIDTNQPVDLIFIIDIMVKIFNRRLQWENESNESMNNSKRELKIYHRIWDRDNPLYKKVHTNKNLLMSLLYNLLSNSFKFTRQGEIVIESFIENERQVMIKLTDTGSGLPDCVLKNWMKPFNMESGAEKSDNPLGSGLGQFIMNTIVKNLKFTMPLPERNSNGCGTIIKISIPINNYPPEVNHGSLMNNTGSLPTKRRTTDTPFILNSEDREQVNYSMETELFQFSNGHAVLNINNLSNIINQNNESFLPRLVTSNKNHIYRLLCFDDDPILINTFVQKLNILLVKYRPDLKFEFDVCYNFEMFYEKFSNNLNNKKHYHFFVLDQNISINLKGVEIAEMIDRTYSACFGERYDNLFINFLFVTEQADSLKFYFDQVKLMPSHKRRLYKFDLVFGKRDHEVIASKILGLVKNE